MHWIEFSKNHTTSNYFEKKKNMRKTWTISMKCIQTNTGRYESCLVMHNFILLAAKYLWDLQSSVLYSFHVIFLFPQKYIPVQSNTTLRAWNRYDSAFCWVWDSQGFPWLTSHGKDFPFHDSFFFWVSYDTCQFHWKCKNRTVPHWQANAFSK